jgi:glycine oxidase
MTYIYDSIIVGGGVIGGSIAFHLARRGKKVLLLEKNVLAGESSRAAAGMLGAQAELESSSPLFPLAKKSREMFPNIAVALKELSGMDIELVNKGMFKVALNDEQAEELKRKVETHRSHGEQAEWLSAEDVKNHESLLSHSVLGAMFLPEDGQVSAHRLSLAFLSAAAVLGAGMKEFASVHSFLIEKGRVKGVRTNCGDYLSENVIVASGAWSAQLLKESGIVLDAYPVKGECFSVVTARPLLEKTIFAKGCYLVPKAGGRTIVGATEHPHTFDKKVSVAGVFSLMDKARRIVPSIVNSQLESTWAGIRPQTGDGLPYLGEHPEYRGLFIAAGHFRNGILLSPITGELVAQWAEGNAVPELEPFRLDRSFSSFIT